ncbi:hypothetical protein OYC64_014097 [Pagothenia borchgrevinki]|uniref:Secreted protein n=1 Tax=Pagothenia borchgrevinki TaxID=8213 RepID=A0ABD2GZB0_PAGBO
MLIAVSAGSGHAAASGKKHRRRGKKHRRTRAGEPRPDDLCDLQSLPPPLKRHTWPPSLKRHTCPPPSRPYRTAPPPHLRPSANPFGPHLEAPPTAPANQCL